MLVQTVVVCVPSCLPLGVEMGIELRVRWELVIVRPGQEMNRGPETAALMLTEVLAYPLLTLEGFRSFYDEGPPSVVEDWISGPNLKWGFLQD